MALEVFTFTARIKARLKIALDWNEIRPLSLTRTPPDLSIAEVHRWIVKVWERSAPIYGRRIAPKPFPCGRCRKELREVPLPGFCSHCGKSVTAGDYVWNEMVLAITHVASVSASQIQPGTLVSADLKMK